VSISGTLILIKGLMSFYLKSKVKVFSLPLSFIEEHFFSFSYIEEPMSFSVKDLQNLSGCAINLGSYKVEFETALSYFIEVCKE
jgi:hypothetical protein